MTKHIRVLLMVAFALAVLTGTAAAYDGESATLKYVTISESSEKDIRVKTIASTVGELLEENNIEIDSDTKISKGLDEPLVSEEVIKIIRPLTITLDVNSEKKTVSTFCSTVGDVLSENSSLVGNDYELQGVKESSRLCNNMTIKVLKPTDKIVKSTEDIPFETKYVNNDELEEGIEKVSQEGANGILEITKKEIYFNSKIERIEEVSRETVKEPVDKIIQVGTKKKEPEAVVSTNSGTVNGLNYKTAITMHSTAYTPYDAGCSGRTATGAKATKGIAAVDKRVIPLGTKLYIPGYGTAIAADTGGAIKGNRIDLCYDTLSEAYSWGRKNITVYILE